MRFIIKLLCPLISIIFLTNKITITMRLYPRKSERSGGVTLFLSVLVLSSIVAVAFSVATVTLVEVQTAGDVLRTEPSYYADLGITEEAIFILKRQVGTPPAPSLGSNCAPSYTGYTGPNPLVANQVKICDVATSHNIEARVLSSASSYGSARRFYLYNPANLAPDSNGYMPSGYGSVALTNTSGQTGTNVTLHVYMCRLDDDCIVSGSWVVNQDLVANSTLLINNINFGAFDGSKYSYELAFTNNSGGTLNPLDGFIQIVTLDTSSNPKGLPYLNKKAVTIQSSKSGLTRRVEVLIPTQ